jgi:hypothetical protein
MNYQINWTNIELLNKINRTEYTITSKAAKTSGENNKSVIMLQELRMIPGL